MSSPIRARLRRLRRIRRSNFRGRVRAQVKDTPRCIFPEGLTAEEVYQRAAPAGRIVVSCADLMVPGVLRWHPYMGSWRHCWHLYRQRVTYRFRTAPVPPVDADEEDA